MANIIRFGGGSGIPSQIVRIGTRSATTHYRNSSYTTDNTYTIPDGVVYCIVNLTSGYSPGAPWKSNKYIYKNGTVVLSNTSASAEMQWCGEVVPGDTIRITTEVAEGDQEYAAYFVATVDGIVA